MIGYHSNDVDIEVIFAHFSLDISPSGVGNCLRVDFECLELGQPKLKTFKARMDS